jgi:hypothetical protein
MPQRFAEGFEPDAVKAMMAAIGSALKKHTMH